MSSRVLIVDDELSMREMLSIMLEKEGCEADIAESGERALELLSQNVYDVVLTDLKMRGIDGLEVCRRLRQGGAVPILMLTARDTVNDRVQGLDAGADDYMVKPFNLDELLARIRALLRRTLPVRPKIYEFGNLVLDTGTRQATRSDRIIDLTAKEYELLELFMRHPRQVLTREMIYDDVWGYDFGGESNIIEVYVRYLRQKLEDEGEPRLIHTVRGMGYVLRDTE